MLARIYDHEYPGVFRFDRPWFESRSSIVAKKLGNDWTKLIFKLISCATLPFSKVGKTTLLAVDFAMQHCICTYFEHHRNVRACLCDPGLDGNWAACSP